MSGSERKGLDPSRRHSGAGALLFAVILTSIITAAGAASAAEREGVPQATNPHNYVVKAYCKVCHTARPPELNFDPVTTCTKCHPANVGNHPVPRHPIGKKARIYVPGKLPLTEDGKIVCYTCHDPHNKSGFSKMLRVDYFGLCVSCHVGY